METRALTSKGAHTSVAVSHSATSAARASATRQLVDNRPASIARNNLIGTIQRVAAETAQRLAVLPLPASHLPGVQGSSLRQESGEQQAPDSRKIVQRVKLYAPKGVQKHKAGHWYSPTNPFKVYATKQAAEAAHSAAGKKYKGKFVAATSLQSIINKKKGHKVIAKHSTTLRAYTMYTYMLTKAQNVLSIALQGPHTVAHRVTASALLQAKTIADLDKIFAVQIPSPTQIDAIVNAEKKNPTPSELERLTRFKADYLEAYNGYQMLSSSVNGKASKGLTRPKHLLNHLLNMHPYATYSWKSGKKASRTSTKGKGESVSNPTFDVLCDTSSASFTDAKAYKNFIATRKQLFTAYPPH